LMCKFIRFTQIFETLFHGICRYGNEEDNQIPHAYFLSIK
jgi:hypothetical protein